MKRCTARLARRARGLWGIGFAVTFATVPSASPREARAGTPESPRRHSTDLFSLIELRDDYTKAGANLLNALVLRGDYAPTRWASLRLELPLSYGEAPAAPPAFGFGDVFARATVRLAAAQTSFLVGTELTIDSAAVPVLGGSKNVIGPFALLSWDLGPRVWVRVQAQHLASIGGDPKHPTVSASSLRPYALVVLPEGFWLLLDQKLQVSHRGPQDVAYTAVFEAGKELSDELSAFVDPGVQLASPWALTWMMSAGVRWTIK